MKYQIKLVNKVNQKVFMVQAFQYYKLLSVFSITFIAV